MTGNGRRKSVGAVMANAVYKVTFVTSFWSNVRRFAFRVVLGACIVWVWRRFVDDGVSLSDSFELLAVLLLASLVVWVVMVVVVAEVFSMFIRLGLKRMDEYDSGIR
jgi:hypothetical protein